QTQNPRTIAQRSHAVLPKCGNSERTPSAPLMASGIAFSSFPGSQGPAVNADCALRAVGVKAEARRGRAQRGALTPRAQGLPFTAAGPSFNCQKPCIQSGEEPFFAWALTTARSTDRPATNATTAAPMTVAYL